MEDFSKSLSGPNWQLMLGRRISSALENNRFALAFIHLKLRRDIKEDYKEGGESKVGIELQES